MPDDNLFWYPSLKYRRVFDGDFDKPLMLDSYIRYYLARLQSMFTYENLPETLPAKWFEHYLLTNGNCLVIEVDGSLVATTGGMGGVPNAYYIPSEYIVSNPHLPNAADITYVHDKELVFNKSGSVAKSDKAVLVLNDTYSQGIMPLLVRYCSMLVENDISLYLADIQARAILNISASDDSTKASAEVYLSKLRAGKLGIIGNNSFLKDLDVKVFKDAADSLTRLIEYHQYIKASLFNELGLNSNYNMKRESINSNESQLNDDMLHPLIDNMLAEREEGVNKINEMFGTNIKVSFNSAWLENEIEEQAVISSIIDPGNDEKLDAGNVDQGEVLVNDSSEDVIDEVNEEDEVINKPVIVESDVIEDNIETEDDTKVVDTLEDLKEDIESIKEDVEDIKEDVEGGVENV